MTTTTAMKYPKKPKLSKSRISSPMLTEDETRALEEIAEITGSSVPGLLAQLGEAAKKGKPHNWHRAVAAFQDAIEK